MRTLDEIKVDLTAVAERIGKAEDAICDRTPIKALRKDLTILKREQKALRAEALAALEAEGA